MNPDMAKSPTEAAYDLGYDDGRKAEQDDFMLRSGLGQLCNQIYQLESTIEHAARGIMAAILVAADGNSSDRDLSKNIEWYSKNIDVLWAATARVREETKDER